MGVALTVTSRRRPTGHPEVKLEGEDGGVLTRRGGEGLQALQHLVATTFRRQLGDDRRMVIDCNGFRREKDAELRQMALVHRGEGAIVRKSAGDGATEPVRAPHRASGHCRGPDGQLRKHRRRVHEDRDHLASRRLGLAGGVLCFATRRHHRGHRHATWTRRHRRRAAERRRARSRIATHSPAAGARYSQPRRATLTAFAVDGVSRRACPATAGRGHPVGFPSPRSYTGEDVVEISAHGNPLLLEGDCPSGHRSRGAAGAARRVHASRRHPLASGPGRGRGCRGPDRASTLPQARLAFDQLHGTLSTEWLRSTPRRST